MLQQELRNERDQNEVTIEHFTVMIQDLKTKGMDEVEDLQSDIAIMREQMLNMILENAQNEIRITQLASSSQYYEDENAELRAEVNGLKFKLIQSQIEKEMNAVIQPPNSEQVEGSYESREDEVQTLRAQLLDLQIELDNSKFRATILEAEKLAKTLDIRDLGS